MDTINYLRDKAASVWSTVWVWVAAHPKTTVIAGLVVLAAAFARKY